MTFQKNVPSFFNILVMLPSFIPTWHDPESFGKKDCNWESDPIRLDYGQAFGAFSWLIHMGGLAHCGPCHHWELEAGWTSHEE